MKKSIGNSEIKPIISMKISQRKNCIRYADSFSKVNRGNNNIAKIDTDKSDYEYYYLFIK